MNEFDKAFETTTKILFEKSLSPLDDYSKWLEKRIPKAKNYKSALSTSEVQIRDYYFFNKIPKDRVAVFEELNALGNKKINIDDGMHLKRLKEQIRDVAYFVPDFKQGKNINVIKTTAHINCINVYNAFDTFWLKNSAYVFSAFGEGLFGSYRLLDSKFCIHCYNVANITSCFEVDSAKNCSNSMFCHNAENLHDCLFCFNSKNLKYAIGNLEVGREKYLEIKKELVDRILENLDNKRDFEIDIYNCLGK
ncbi:MAG: hypothetical protein WC501_04435 [Candidatus Micrarchaeia archaeon]